MASRRIGKRRPHPSPLRRRDAPSGSEHLVARAARSVLRWEGATRVRVEITLLAPAAMRRLNRRATGRTGLTDVIAYALPQTDGSVVGDVYLCPAAAARWTEDGPAPARALRDELIRLAVHGTLHVLGYDHPDGAGRTRSAMWRRQERYVKRLLGRSTQ